MLLITIYLGLFALYSYIDFKQNDRSKLGIITSVTVFVCDIFVFSMFSARLIKTPSWLSFLLFASRILIFAFGIDGWMYGYMIAYMMVATVISHEIIAKHFPYKADFDSIDFVKLKKQLYEVNNLAKFPEALLIFISLLLVITVALTEAFAPKGVTVKPIEFTVNKNPIVVKPMLGAFVSVLIVLTEMAANLAYRTYVRKYNKVKDIRYWYLWCIGFDVNFLSLVGLYLVILAWVVLCYEKTKSYFLLIWGIFLPAILLCMAVQHLYFKLNDFMWVEDIKLLNKRNQLHGQALAATHVQA